MQILPKFLCLICNLNLNSIKNLMRFKCLFKKNEILTKKKNYLIFLSIKRTITNVIDKEATILLKHFI